jgi:hypothetical protein
MRSTVGRFQSIVALDTPLVNRYILCDCSVAVSRLLESQTVLFRVHSKPLTILVITATSLRAWLHQPYRETDNEIFFLPIYDMCGLMQARWLFSDVGFQTKSE